MDIETLYELADKTLPGAVYNTNSDKWGTCSHVKSSEGNKEPSLKLLNLNNKSSLFPIVPTVPNVLVNLVNISSARDGGGEINCCAENEFKSHSLLSQASSELNHPLNDLLDWFYSDMDIISVMTPGSVKAYVSDYILNIHYYRRIAEKVIK